MLCFTAAQKSASARWRGGALTVFGIQCSAGRLSRMIIARAEKALPTLFLPSFHIRDNLLMIESALATAGIFVYTVFIDFFQQFKLKYRPDIRTYSGEKTGRAVLFGCVLRTENRWEEYGS
jgi:hypothetical protein